MSLAYSLKISLKKKIMISLPPPPRCATAARNEAAGAVFSTGPKEVADAIQTAWSGNGTFTQAKADLELAGELYTQ